jgi:hypothetical protein
VDISKHQVCRSPECETSFHQSGSSLLVSGPRPARALFRHFRPASKICKPVFQSGFGFSLARQLLRRHLWLQCPVRGGKATASVVIEVLPWSVLILTSRLAILAANSMPSQADVIATSDLIGAGSCRGGNALHRTGCTSRRHGMRLGQRVNPVREKAPFPVRFLTRRLTCNE